MPNDRRPVRVPAQPGSSQGRCRRPGAFVAWLLAAAATCLMFAGCGATSGSAGRMRRPASLFGWRPGKDSLTEAVRKDPFPEAADVNLGV